MSGDPGVHLVEAPTDPAPVEALAARLAARGGGRVRLGDLARDLDRRGRRAWLPLRAGHRAWTWDAADRRDRRWWPQGVTTSADARTGGTTGGADDAPDLVAVSWYARPRPDDPAWAGPGGQGVRVSVLDPATARYTHVLLVHAVPGADGEQVGTAPVQVHAGGLVWAGAHLHVAATARGLVTCHLDDLMRVADGDVLPGAPAGPGPRYVLPVRTRLVARTADGTQPLRYSFCSVDDGADGADGADGDDGGGPGLLVGEYGRGSRSRRLARFALDPGTGRPRLDPSGRAVPVLHEGGVRGMQGAVVVDGRHLVSVSRGPWTPGSVWAGAPGHLREHRFELPMGPEDLSWDAGRRRLWTVTEHPRRRWVVALEADRFLDRAGPP